MIPQRSVTDFKGNNSIKTNQFNITLNHNR